MAKFEKSDYEQVPSVQEGVDIFEPKSGKSPEAAGAEVPEGKERKVRWKRLAELALWGSTALGAFQGYEYWKPKAENVKLDVTGETSFALKTPEGKETDVSIEREQNGEYTVRAVVTGGAAYIGRGAHGEWIADAGSTISFTLPASTDTHALMDRLRAARHPGDVLQDLMSSSHAGDVAHLKKNGQGMTYEAYHLRFMPGSKRGEGDHAIQTVTDENGKKRITHIAFTEGERRAQGEL